MPSSNKTPYLGLNDWAESDKPKREDFANDNKIIDKKSDEIDNKIDKIPITLFSLPTLADAFSTTPGLYWGWNITNAPRDSQVFIYMIMSASQGAIFTLAFSMNADGGVYAYNHNQPGSGWQKTA